MKINRIITKWLAPVALAALNLQSPMAFGGLMFPIVTNDTVATGFSATCAGTNYLVGIQGDIVSIGTNGDGNSYQVTAQLFGQDGTPVGGRIKPVPGHTGGNPFAATSGTNLLLVWPDDYSDGVHYFGGNIMAQLLNPSGALIGSWFPITTNSEELGGFAYGAGKYLVTWNDYRNGMNWAVYGQFISSTGAPVGNNFFISDIAPDFSQDREPGPGVAFDGTNFLVVWQISYLMGNSTNHNVTYGVFISPTGTMGMPFAISQADSPNDGPLNLVFNGSNYLVVWPHDTGLGGTNQEVYNIYGRFVTPSGTFPGNEFAIVTNGNPNFPGLAFDGANYLLCWNVNGGATNSNIQCEFLNASGQPMGPQFTPFSAKGSAVPLVSRPIYDGKRFVIVTSLSASGFTPTNNAAIYGAFIPASTARPQFSSSASYTNKQFSLSLTGTPGINYAIQAATNLPASNWMPLVTNSPTNGAFSFTDTGATNRSRFYRAVKQ